jgi:tetratricopeptide (TPR) repeat protein
VAVSNFNVPPPVATSDPYAAPLALGGNKKNNGQQQPSAYTITGTLAVTYQSKTRAGKSLDAEPITVKFTEEVNTVSKAKEFVGKIPHPGKSKASEEDNVRTVGDVEQILVTRVSDRIAARLVNTDERVEALLARGSLDEYNRYAEAGQWSDFVEKLETMPPLPRAEDDAYRLYNIGVGNEALGYKATTPEAARRDFEKAVIDYRKASEANPHEKYFLEPINRIEIALEHYKKLATASATSKKK